MSSPAARRRKNARALMIEDNKSSSIIVSTISTEVSKPKTTYSPSWYVECIKCKKMIYQLYKIPCDQTMKGHTTAIVDGFDKWVAPHDFNTMGIYDKIDVCWTCFECFESSK